MILITFKKTFNPVFAFTMSLLVVDFMYILGLGPALKNGGWHKTRMFLYISLRKEQSRKVLCENFRSTEQKIRDIFKNLSCV